MAYTYTQLYDALLVYMVTDSSDADLPNAITTILNNAELRCYRDVDFQATRKYERNTFGNTGTFADALLAGPLDLVICRQFGYFTPVGTTQDNGTYHDLQRIDETVALDYWPTRATRTDTPKYYSELDFGQLLIVGTPSQPYGVRMALTYRPAPISASNPTTWLSLNAPDLLFAACMCEAAAYQKNYGAQADDAKMATTWEATYQRVMQQTMLEEIRRKAAGYANSSQSQPPAQISPKLQ